MNTAQFVDSILYSLLLTGLGWVLVNLLKFIKDLKKKIDSSITEAQARKIIEEEVGKKYDLISQQIRELGKKFDSIASYKIRTDP